MNSPDMDREGKGSHAAAFEACEEGSERLYSVVTDAVALACSLTSVSSDPLVAVVVVMTVDIFLNKAHCGMP